MVAALDLIPSTEEMYSVRFVKWTYMVQVQFSVGVRGKGLWLFFIFCTPRLGFRLI